MKNNQELFLLYQKNRDIKTRNKIVENNLQYVKQIANEYSYKSKEHFDDLFQVGTIGLIKAVEAYDLSKNVKFTPFALPKIKGEILHWLRDKGHLIKIPRAIQDLHQKIKKYSKLNKVSYEKAAQALEITKENALELNFTYSQDFLPIKETILQSKEEDSLIIPIDEILSHLPDNQRLVISCLVLQEMTIKDTAEVLQSNYKNIKKTEELAIKHLQSIYRS